MKTLLLLSLLLFLTACGNTSTPEAEPESALPAGITAVFNAEVPADEAIPIPEARATLQPGDEVLLEGRIMGMKNPFIEGRSIFVLGDNATLTPCSDMEDMSCETPWDACCDPVEVRSAGVASIQVVDADGNLLKHSLEGVGNLEKLSTVRVSGVVAPGSNPESLVVNATAVQVM